MNWSFNDTVVIDWSIGASQKMMLHKAVVESHVQANGKASDFKAQMTVLCQWLKEPTATPVEGARKLYDICQSFELLDIVGRPTLPAGPVRRLDEQTSTAVHRSVTPIRGAADRPQAPTPESLELARKAQGMLVRKYLRDA